MKETKYVETISEKTIREINSVANKMSIEDGLKFISTNLKIAPNCVELILTTLGYIIRANDRIGCTDRLFKTLHYDQSTGNYLLTANGLELLYRLVFNSVCKDKTAKKDFIHNYPVIFDGYVQTLAASDDKKLIQIDVALDEIYDIIINIANIDKDTFYDLLDIKDKVEFNSNGRVSKCIGDFNHYTYYIYNAENIDKYGVVNALSINSVEIYISKETYDKLLHTINESIKAKIEAGAFKPTNNKKSNANGDTLRKCKTDKYISLSYFIAMIVNNCDNKYNETDILLLMVRIGLIKLDKNNRIYVNDPTNNEYFHVNEEYGSIFIKSEKALKLFLALVSMDINLFNAMQEIDLTKNPYSGLFNSYGYNYMTRSISPISPISSASLISPISPISPISSIPNPLSIVTKTSTTVTSTIKYPNENNCSENNKK